MAEAVFADMLEKANLKDAVKVDSFGTSDEEEGNGIYPPALAELKAHGITYRHTAKQLCLDDVKSSDLVLAMDEANRRNILRLTGGRFADKVKLLCDFTDRPRSVADPWYTRDFSRAYADIEDGCRGLLAYLCERL